MIRRSPLDGLALINGLRELPFLAQLSLRIDPSVAADPGHLLGFDLPMKPNTVAGDERLAALWLGPDEWLIVGHDGEAARLEGLLREARTSPSGAIVDVSANRTTLELRGPRARELLEFGCLIDLYPRVFGPGSCAQTILARATVIVWFVTDEPEPVYRLLVRPSLAAYVAAWLADAADGLTD